MATDSELAVRLAKIHTQVEALQAELDASMERAANPRGVPQGPDLVLQYVRTGRMKVRLMVEGASVFWEFENVLVAQEWLARLASEMTSLHMQIGDQDPNSLTHRLPPPWSI